MGQVGTYVVSTWEWTSERAVVGRRPQRRLHPVEQKRRIVEGSCIGDTLLPAPNLLANLGPLGAQPFDRN